MSSSSFAYFVVKSSSSFVCLAVAVLLASSARAAAPGPTDFSGSIVTDDGKPVLGVTIQLPGRGNPIATSDANGNLHFRPTSRTLATDNVVFHDFRMVLNRATMELLTGSKPGAKRAAASQIAKNDALRVKLTVVSKTTGRPLSGARVWINSPSLHKAVTDKSGAVVIDGIDPRDCWANVFADGYAHRQATFDLRGKSGTFEQTVAMERGGIIRGIVVDQFGKPVKGVAINHSYDYWSGESSLASNWGEDDVPTDKDGRFEDRFAPLDMPIGMRFTEEGYEPQQLDEDHHVVLTTVKPTADLRIVLTRKPSGGSVTGIVSDTLGHPIAGARVVRLWNVSRPASVTTDAQGRFRLNDLSREKIRGRVIGITAKGFAPQAIDFKFGTAQHPTEVIVKLEPGHTLRGRIVDEHGKPMAQVRFTFRSASYLRRFDFDENNFTSDDGSFAFDSLPADAKISLATPFGGFIQNAKLPLDTPQPVTFTIDSPGEIRGRIVDATTGKPLPAFHIRLDFPDAPSRPDESVDSTHLAEWWNPGELIRSVDGRFAIGPLPVRCRVKIILDAEGYERNVVQAVAAQHADQQAELKIAMLPIRESDYCTLSGRVVDHRGKGVAGESVRLIASPREYGGLLDSDFDDVPMLLDSKSYVDRHVAAVTDANGGFKFDKIPPHEFLQILYSSQIEGGRWVGHERTRPGSKQSITIVTVERATIHASIDRKKLPDAQTVFLDAIRNHESIARHAIYLDPSQSSFELTNILPGQYSLTVNRFETVTENGETSRKSIRLTTRKLNLSSGEDCRITLP